MKPLNEKELAVFAGFAVLGAPDPVSGETSVTHEERIALYRALRIDHFEVTKDEFAAVEAMYDQGTVTIAAAAEMLNTKKGPAKIKIYKAVYNSVKALAGGSVEKMSRGDRKGSLDELKDALQLSDADLASGTAHGKKPAHKASAEGGAPAKGGKKMMVIIVVLVLVAAAGAVWFLKFK